MISGKRKKTWKQNWKVNEKETMWDARSDIEVDVERKYIDFVEGNVILTKDEDDQRNKLNSLNCVQPQ